jgi:hypothetical protein
LREQAGNEPWDILRLIEDGGNDGDWLHGGSIAGRVCGRTGRGPREMSEQE